MFDNKFTWDDGIKAQQAELLRWQHVLKPEAYAKLTQLVEQATCAAHEFGFEVDGIVNGYDVPRGQMITEFVVKLLPHVVINHG